MSSQRAADRVADLTPKERQGRGLDALAVSLRPYVEAHMVAALPAQSWIALYEAKESHRRNRPFRLHLDDPRQLLQMVRFERTAFPDVDASKRAWLEELIQAANRAAHVTTISQREADRALDTMLLLAESLGFEGAVPVLIALRLEATPAPTPSTQTQAPVEDLADAPTDVLEATEPADEEPVVPPTAPDEGVADLSPGTLAVTVHVAGVHVTVWYQEAINLALTQNAVSPVRSVRVTNELATPTQVDLLQIAIGSPAAAGDQVVGAPLVLAVGLLDVGETFEAQASDLAMLLNPAAFTALDEATTTELTLTVSTSGVRAVTRGPVRLLTADEWWAAGIPELLAAFVRPNDPAVAELLRSASAILDERTGSSSLEGYQSGPRRVRDIAEAVFDALAARRLTYAEPPASFEGTGQRIRTHTQVLADGLGTCLDLACLYAAALEQAGLHPVLALFEGHAFTGYLSEDEQLPSVVVRDAPTAVTIADSDLFDAVELTVACTSTASFDGARQATSHWWSADLGRLRFLLDVHAAHLRVRPLPSVRVDGDTRVIEVTTDSLWSEPRRPSIRQEPRPAGARQSRSSAPPRVQQWERALLDMTYANPLLKRKASGSLAVHVPSRSLGLFEDLVSAGQKFGLVAHDEIDQLHRAQGARTAADIDPASVRAIMEREHTVFVATSEQDYERRIKALARRSKTAVEETGADNLYLTLGSLEWTDGARHGAAPLFLVPVRLSGGRGVMRYSLTLDDSRERVPNYCLIEKLKDFGLVVPELEEPGADGSGIDVPGALGALRTAILRGRNTVGFHVEETADLALLQFSTLEMWRDLREHWPQFLERPAVAHLVTSAGSTFADGIAPPEATALDEARTYLPIPADGSQIEAVRWAGSGKTFVLEGPPGTGKSQTITNLIADSLANGRRILFVAEKAAALDVVKRRLDEVGLGVFSLDVHGRAQAVSAVRDQLRLALEERAAHEPGWEALQSAYAAVTGKLADYPSRLHQAGPVGLSAWDAHQLVLEQVELGTTVDSALEVPRPIVLGDVNLADLYESARQLGEALTDLGRLPSRSPWRLARVDEPESLPRELIAEAVREVGLSVAALGGHPVVAGLVETLPPEELGPLTDWLETVQRGTAWPPGAAARVAAGPWVDEATRRHEAVDAFRAQVDEALGPFAPPALDLPIDQLLVRSREADGKFFGKKKRRLQLVVELRHALRGDLPLADLTAQLQALEQLQRRRDELVGHVRRLAGVAPRPGWNPSDDRDVSWFVTSTESIQVAAALAPVLSRNNADPQGQAVEQLLTAAPTTTVGSSDAVRRWVDAWHTFRTLLGADSTSVAAWTAGRSTLESVRHELPDWSVDAAGSALVELQRWARLRRLLDGFSALGMTAVVEQALADDLDADEIEPGVRLGVAQSVLEERLATTGLDGFDEVAHRRRVADYANRSAAVRERMPNALRTRVLGARTFNPGAHLGQVGELRSELGRRRGGRSVRGLLHDFEDLITQITPCLLMSPQSVARFLPSTAAFDLVVFDEASQIRVPEAVGAMGRAKATVIVGDSKQMPPTAMFATGSDAADDGADATAPGGTAGLVPADLESILSEAVESQFPRKLLSWHYRSRNESLIAFSNAHYYDGRLSSFPVAPGSVAHPIELRQVAGTWEGGSRGAARVNRTEAQEVVYVIRELLAEEPARSIGVVTFNSQQRDLVLDLLESDDDPAVADRLQADDEPLFVKNLENVQGDERDVILFSLAFSEDERGRVPLNWGPLTRAGGERRLNVAITRAKERVIVICSFDPGRLDLSSSSSQGLSDLRDYLLLASADKTTPSGSRRGARDAHLEDLAAALSAAGLQVRTNVGLSDFVVDLAVRQQGSEEWLAVLLDGPAWASRLSVGDRETLPVTVLTQMGWARVERVWLPSWLRDRSRVVASLLAATADLGSPSRQARQDAAVEVSRRLSSPPPFRPALGGMVAPAVPAKALVADAVVAPATRRAVRYVAADESVVHPAEHLDDGSVKSRALVQAEIDRVIEVEAPILADRVVQVVAHRFGLSRVRESRAAQLHRLVSGRNVRRSANGDRVVWRRDADPRQHTDFRVPRAGEQRPLSAIPYEELRNAMVHLAREGHGVGLETLIRETARIFGVTRLASVARPRLQEVLISATREGRLEVHSGVASAVDQP